MRLHRTRLATLPALAALALVAACGQVPTSAPATTPSSPPAAAMTPNTPAPLLTAYFWDLTAMHDASGRPQATGLRPDQPAPRLQFEGSHLSLQRLCNTLGGGYRVDGERLQVQGVMSTKRACVDQALMALESRMGAQLPQVQSHALRPAQAGGAPTLSLLFADGSRWEFTGTPTPATRYGSAGERMFLEVAPQRVPCNHPLMRDAQCLQVRDVRFGDNGVKQSVGEWRIFQGGIDGYTHEPGIRNVLRIQRYHRQNVPADASAYAYVLDMVVESERVR